MAFNLRLLQKSWMDFSALIVVWSRFGGTQEIGGFLRTVGDYVMARPRPSRGM